MRLDRYGWSGGTEAMLRFGPEAGPVLVAILPLFEEANRTRTFTMGLLRLLEARGLACVLPDLPGTGESILPTEDFRPPAAREALDALVTRLGTACYALGIRGGCLLDGVAPAHGRYHLAPVAGSTIVRDLGRTRQAEAGIRDSLDPRWFLQERWMESAEHVRVAGNLLSTDALMDLSLLEPFDRPGVPRRVARLASDAAPADIHLDGTPLWRTKEPGDDPAFAAALADDILGWIAACEG